jgi:hypothetical protein
VPFIGRGRGRRSVQGGQWWPTTVDLQDGHYVSGSGTKERKQRGSRWLTVHDVARGRGGVTGD